MNKISTKSFVMLNGDNAMGTPFSRGSRRISQKKFPFLGVMLLTAVFLISAGEAWGQTQTILLKRNTTTGNPEKVTSSDPGTISNNNVYTPPTGYYISKIECWGAGGGGQYEDGMGGGGGAYARTQAFTDIPAGVGVTVSIGKGGNAGTSNSTSGVNGGSTTVSYTANYQVSAVGGYSGGAGYNVWGKGGQASSCTFKGWTKDQAYSGGNGADDGSYWGTKYGGGGGSGAGTTGKGNDGQDGDWGHDGAGGSYKNYYGGAGGNGGKENGNKPQSAMELLIIGARGFVILVPVPMAVSVSRLPRRMWWFISMPMGVL